MVLVGSEQEVLKVVAELGYANKFQIKRRTGLSLGYIEYLTSYLMRRGYLISLGQGLYGITPTGKKMLLPSGAGTEMVLDKDLIREIASQAAKEVAREIRIKGGEVYQTENKGKVRIKTDFTMPVEDESIGLESNINRIGTKVEKEKSDIEKSVELFKKIQKKGTR